MPNINKLVLRSFAGDSSIRTVLSCQFYRRVIPDWEKPIQPSYKIEEENYSVRYVQYIFTRASYFLISGTQLTHFKFLVSRDKSKEYKADLSKIDWNNLIT